jgi:hypothetical protein
MSEQEPSARPQGLPNVSMMSLSQLLSEENTALAKAVKRLAGEVAKPEQPLSAFTSYVE